MRRKVTNNYQEQEKIYIAVERHGGEIEKKGKFVKKE